MAPLLELLSIAGTIAFAVSGSVLAAKRKMDWVGFIFIANITGMGGGTLRDLLLDTPVFWLGEWHYMMICSIAAIVTYYATKQISRKSKALLWADAVGMALFSALGAQKALMMGMNVPVATIMGIFSACVGGIIRDIILNDVPVVFQKEIYITASLLGALGYCMATTLLGISETTALISGVSIAFVVRALAITKNLSLPAHQGLDQEPVREQTDRR